MSQSVETQRLSAFLRVLKSRADHGYRALAMRSGVSSSALHRYCTGASVPSDYRMLRQFAVECGASQTELRELHRLWVLADAVRRAHLDREKLPEPQRRSNPVTQYDVRSRSASPFMLLVAAALAGMAGAVAWQAAVRAAPTPEAT